MKKKLNSTVELKFHANRLNCSAIVMRSPYTYVPSVYDKVSCLKYYIDRMVKWTVQFDFFFFFNF